MGRTIPTRRTVLKAAGAGALMAAAPGLPVQAAAGWRMPSGAHPHTRTFMGWPALSSIWADWLPNVRQDIARIARAAARYEPVVVIARPDQAARAAQLCGPDVEILPLMLDDLWLRDTGPTFLLSGDGRLAGLDTNFNGWGDKRAYRQPFANDAKLAAALLSHYGIQRIKAPFTTEGGSLETDGQGTLLATESSIVNDNRNPGRSKAQLTQSLKTALGLDQVIWFDGIKGKDITDAHVDALCRFVGPGMVLISRPHPDTPADVWTRLSDRALAVLRSARDAGGRPLTIIPLTDPDYAKLRFGGDTTDFLATYINFYEVDGAVLVPEFGHSSADSAAKATLQSCYPGHDIVQLNIDWISAGGGSIHCATQNQPAPAS